jgi:hypothetical protein
MNYPEETDVADIVDRMTSFEKRRGIFRTSLTFGRHSPF